MGLIEKHYIGFESGQMCIRDSARAEGDVDDKADGAGSLRAEFTRDEFLDGRSVLSAPGRGSTVDYRATPAPGRCVGLVCGFWAGAAGAAFFCFFCFFFLLLGL